MGADVGVEALFTGALHLLPDAPDGTDGDDGTAGKPHVAADARAGPDSAMAVNEWANSAAMNAAVENRLQNAEHCVGAAYRIMLACTRYGSVETTNHFVKQMMTRSNEREALLLAAAAGALSSRRGSVAALGFLQFWEEMLRDDPLRARPNELPHFLRLLETLARMVEPMMMPLAQRLQGRLDQWRSKQHHHGVSRDRFAAGSRDVDQEKEPLATTLVLFGHAAALMTAIVNALAGATLCASSKEIDAAAKELCLGVLIARPAEDDSRARLLPGASLTVSGDGSADHHDVALASNTRGTLRFLSTALIYDAMCTRIEATSGADAKEAAETAEPRARLVASVKGVLASVCALDEERQFELFQLVASLEARYVPVSPARMGGITHAAGTLLFRRALEDYMRKAGMIEADGEKAIELCSVVQELPQRRAILLLVTNRALYLLRPAAASLLTTSSSLYPSDHMVLRLTSSAGGAEATVQSLHGFFCRFWQEAAAPPPDGLERAPAQLALNTAVRMVLGLLQLLLIPAASAWLCHTALERRGAPEPLYAAAVTALFAFVIARAFSLVMSCALDTLFVCCVRDKAEYSSAFMSERLHSAFGYDKSERREKKKARREAKAKAAAEKD